MSNRKYFFIKICLDITLILSMFFYAKSLYNITRECDRRVDMLDTQIKIFKKNIEATKKDTKKDTKKADLYDALIMSIIEVESNFNEKATSSDGRCIGLMQVKGGSFVPSENIKQGIYILHNNFNRALSEELTPLETIHKTLTAYNRGYHGSNKYYKKHKTYVSAYSKKVLGKIEKYKTKGAIE